MPQQPFLQVVLAERDGRTSGAEIRNTANFAAASNMLPGEVFTLERFDRGAGGNALAAPTVAAIDPRRVDDLILRIGMLQPQFVLFEGVALLDAITAARRGFPRLCLVLDCHNVESAVEAELRRSRLPGPVRFLAPLIHQAALGRSRRADCEAMRLADAAWFCSAADLAAAQRLSSLREADVIANPIPPWVLEAGDRRTEAGDEVLFLGHLGYPPNRRAVGELCAAIMPRVRRLRPGCRLHVCGRSPSATMARAVEAVGGRLTADPADLHDAYRRAAVVAVPLREGGGTRIKVIEALAIGRPLVASGKAVEGLGLAAGEHYVRAETPGEFAAAIAGLFDDRDAARSLAARGRSFILAAFGPRVRQAAVRDALQSVLNLPPR